MTLMYDGIDGRIMARYKESALRLGIPLAFYLSQGQSGKRYCSRCLKWKRKFTFRGYLRNSTYYSGICKLCTTGKSSPRKVDPAIWGPSLRAAAKIGITVELYLQKRSENYRWCSDHKDWFDATTLLEGNNPNITRCKDCNRARQAAFRLMNKGRSVDS